jgi:hypothetical protein
MLSERKRVFFAQQNSLQKLSPSYVEGATTHSHQTMTPEQDQKLIDILDTLDSSLERIAYALESISGKQSGIANSLLQLSDIHGSGTPGPY